MVTGVELATGVVVIVNVALVLRAGTVTEAGTPAADELPLSDTTTPPLGAGPLNVTVPWEMIPPTTLAGFAESVFNAAGSTVSVAVFVTPLKTAEIVTGVELATGVVVIVNVALVLRAGTVTVTGTSAADGVSLLSDISTPPIGAGAASVTVPLELVPPGTLAGLTDSELKGAGT
jgi:hypothetical protein